MQTTIIPVAAATPTPPVESRPSPKAPNTHAFANLLRQRQMSAPTPAKPAEAKPARSDGSVDTVAQSPTAKTGANGAASSAEARRDDDRKATVDNPGTQRAERRRDDDASGRGDESTTDTASTRDASGTGVPLTHGLIAQHRLLADARESGPSGKAGRTGGASTSRIGDGSDGDADAATTSSPSSDAPSLRRTTDMPRKDDPTSFACRATSDDGADASPAADAGPAAAHAPTTAIASTPRAEATSPTAIAPTPAPAQANPAAPLDAAVATPMASPDFAQAFAVQVSVLVQDGVQRAELHLNPSEMGPVSVQIVVEGTQARIDFGADAPATRQAIEAGLPELASALRDAGMTLQGGGVSQHARDPHPEAKSGAGSGGSGIRPVYEEQRPTQLGGGRVVTAGGVDLYA